MRQIYFFLSVLCVGKAIGMQPSYHNISQEEMLVNTAFYGDKQKFDEELAKASPQRINKIEAIRGQRWLAPLHWAAFRGDSYMVNELLRAGADPNKTGDTATPLLFATTQGVYYDPRWNIKVNNQGSEQGYAQVIKLLLQAGADPTIADAKGRTPASVALSPLLQRALQTQRGQRPAMPPAPQPTPPAPQPQPTALTSALHGLTAALDVLEHVL